MRSSCASRHWALRRVAEEPSGVLVVPDQVCPITNMPWRRPNSTKASGQRNPSARAGAALGLHHVLGGDRVEMQGDPAAAGRVSAGDDVVVDPGADQEGVAIGGRERVGAMSFRCRTGAGDHEQRPQGACVARMPGRAIIARPRPAPARAH